MSVHFTTNLLGGALGAMVLLAAAPAFAQSAPPQDLAAAYRKEYAFLAAEKEALSARLKTLSAEAEAKAQQGQRDLQALQKRLIDTKARADAAEAGLGDMEREAALAEERGGGLADALLRARDGLAEAGIEVPPPPATGAAREEVGAYVERLFQAAAGRIRRDGLLHEENGAFFLTDGTQVQGRVLRWGRVAAFGLSEQGSGALAPAGGGRFKLWPESDLGAARALGEGRRPAHIGLFLFESLDKDAERREQPTVAQHINQGGPIAWGIVALGGIALLLALLRSWLLARAGMGIDALLDRVIPLLMARRAADAAELCEVKGGAAGRVLAVVLRHLDRERAHLEDLAAEAMLHEQPRLERFSGALAVIASVATLLGLLGTVTGMIATFDIITEYGTGNPKLLAGGIAEALITTKLGLMVAIPTLLVSTLLSAWAEGIQSGIEKASLRVMNVDRLTLPPANTPTATFGLAPEGGV